MTDPSFLQSVNVSILPRNDNTYDLGSSSLRWNNIYVGGEIINPGTEVVLEQQGDTYGTTRIRLQNRGGSNGMVIEQAGSVDLVDINFYSLNSSGRIRLENRSADVKFTTPEFEISLAGTMYYALATTGIHPVSDNSYSLGTSSYRWKDLYLGDLLTISRSSAGTWFADLVSSDSLGVWIRMRNADCDWLIGHDASEIFTIYDYLNGTEPFRIEKGAPTNRLYITSGGHIGINTNSPSWLLHLVDAKPRIGLKNTNTGGIDWVIGSGTAGGEDQFGIYDAASAVWRMVIDSSGKVGIGTTSPSAKLHIYHTGEGDDLTIETTDTSYWNSIGFVHPNRTWAIGVPSNNSNFVIRDNTGGYNVLWVNAGGGVSIYGVVTPTNNNVYDIGSSDYRWRWIYAYKLSLGGEANFPLNVYNNFWWTWTSVIRGYYPRAGPNYGVMWIGSRRNVHYYGLTLDLANWSLDKIWYYDGSSYHDYTGVLGEWGGSAYSLLSSSSQYIYLGDNSKFTEIYVYLTTAGAGYSIVVEYSTGTDSSTGDTTWSTLTVTDGTNNLSQSGWIYWSAPSDWTAAPLQVGGTSVDSTSRYWIRIYTSADPTTVAETNFINISGLANYIIAGAVWNRTKFRVDYRGNIYAAGALYLYDGVEARSQQTTYYIAQNGGYTYTNTHIRPASNNAYDLGTSSYIWRTGYFNTLKYGYNLVNTYRLTSSDTINTDALLSGFYDCNGSTGIFASSWQYLIHVRH